MRVLTAIAVSKLCIGLSLVKRSISLGETLRDPMNLNFHSFTVEFFNIFITTLEQNWLAFAAV